MISAAVAQGSTLSPMTLADLDEVLVIERVSYPNPWSKETFLREMETPQALLFVDHRQGGVAGYLCGWYLYGEFHLQNISVAPSFRRQGIARQMLEALRSLRREEPLERIFLEVRVSNEAAIALYGSLGFQTTAHRKAQYPDGEDAYFMELPLA